MKFCFDIYLCIIQYILKTVFVSIKKKNQNIIVVILRIKQFQPLFK